MNKEKLFITLTSWEKRINNLPVVLLSLLKQTKLPDKIIINLSLEEFPNKEKNLSEEFNNFIIMNPLVEINWVEKNIRQWKKTIPTMLRYPNDCIICVDDDKIYPNNFIETLWEEHLKYPNNPITVNDGYFLLDKLLQHAGHGTLDKLEYYGGFKNVLSDELYKMSSSDSFFTLLANENGHPVKYCGKTLNIKDYNPIFPLCGGEKTGDIKVHKKMYDYLVGEKIIKDLIKNNEIDTPYEITHSRNLHKPKIQKRIVKKIIRSKKSYWSW